MGGTCGGVSANMTSFLPIPEAKAPAYLLGIAPPFIPEGITGNMTGNFTAGVGTGVFPLSGVIQAIAAAGTSPTPAQIPLLILCCFILVTASLSSSYLMRASGSGSLIVKSMTIVAIMGIFVAIGNLAFEVWMVYLFILLALAIAMMSRHFSWG